MTLTAKDNPNQTGSAPLEKINFAALVNIKIHMSMLKTESLLIESANRQ